MNKHIYTLKKPASCYGQLWREALPLGNGLTGALIPGAIAEEHIQFNRHDLWRGAGNGGEIPDVSDAFRKMRADIDLGDYLAANRDCLMHALRDKGYAAAPETPYPHGWLDITQTHDSMFRHYRRGVNMRTGEAFVTFETDEGCFRREMFISRADDIAVIRMTADRPFTAVYNYRLFPETAECVTTPGGFLRKSSDGVCAVNVVFSGDFSSAVDGDTLSVTGRDYLILQRISSHGADTDLAHFANETYESLLARHTALHTALYDAVSVSLSDDGEQDASNEELLADAYDGEASNALLERMWRFGRYLFISAASERGNPVPLYGLWHGGPDLGWSQYVANENVQMTYWHTMTGGLSYAVPALIRYYTSKMPVFRECAKKLFGMRGIWISAYTTPGSAGVSVPVTVISNWISCAGWLCRHFWEYYLYTGDESLLREEILPFMYESALFYRDYAVDDGEFVRLYPSVSPENTPSNLMHLRTVSHSGHPAPAVENATMDFAVMRELFSNLLDGIAVTGMYADEAESFRTLLAKIPAYQINEDGAVKEWMHPDLSDNYRHRHLSHIYPIFPGTEVTAFNDPDLFEKFRRAVALRKLGSQSGWSLTHMACIYCRLGEAERAVRCLDIMTKSVVLDSLFTVHNDWRRMGMTLNWEDSAIVQLDAAFGAVNVLQEMLFCPQKDALSVLPALPDRFPHGHAEGFVFPGGTLDLAWEDDGTVTVTVFARKPIDTALLIRGERRDQITLGAGEVMTRTYARGK